MSAAIHLFLSVVWKSCATRFALPDVVPFQLILWNIVERKALACMPTICGQVFCIRTSPIDPGWLTLFSLGPF